MHRNAIYDEGAYEAAIARRIRANARIGRERRWLAEDPSRAALAEQIRQLGYDKGGFFASLSQSLSEWGSLSPAQEAAARNAIEKGAERRAALVAADAGSEWIGEVGERQDFRLRLSGLAEFEGAYGAVYLHFLKGEAGNVAIYGRLLPIYLSIPAKLEPEYRAIAAFQREMSATGSTGGAASPPMTEEV